MTDKKNVVDQKQLPQMKPLHRFTLKGGTKFQGQFSQTCITVQPTHLNGDPIDLAVAMINKIQRVNDPGWMASRKLRYFIFELHDGSKIAGLPNNKECSVSTIFSGDCEVEFENILEVEKVE